MWTNTEAREGCGCGEQPATLWGGIGVGDERMSPAEGHGQGLRNKVWAGTSACAIQTHKNQAEL